MKVYITGLVYLTGCDEQEGMRGYAPVATGHHPSLWIEVTQINEAETDWWAGLRRPPREVDGVELIEFVMPDRATIRFPGAGPVHCEGLDDGLPKLKKKKKEKDDDPDVPFPVDPNTANAVVEMHGGSITPRRFRNTGLAEWTSADGGLAISVRQNDSNESRTITLNDANAAIGFLNMHELPAGYRVRDKLSGSHEDDFDNLNGDPDVQVFVANAKLPGSVGHIDRDAAAAIVKYLGDGGCSCGRTPCCC